MCMTDISDLLAAKGLKYIFLYWLNVYGSRREKTCLTGFANNKDADQPVQQR